ncbi:TonB-dependent receptor [Pedobacter sp. SYSU D00535]|uniref:SusC/RagA family TonB-linked outer membrane protein n=1 Tax=Pedobacter sp. SYSU D00535 TaxID=2810308 RepID=UPI001A96869E|nr:TonB-dependent receptor [Pedobacter sp. SYSU D00535]
MRQVVLMMCLMFTAVNSAFSQTRQVSGKVVDRSGEALIGVSVLVKGTTVGASTDVNGNFRINVPQGGNPVLVFKYLGYRTREVSVGSQSAINVTLEDDAQALNEVVVVGYGTQQRRDLTGSVSSVSGEVIERNPVTSVAEAITGRMPGVQVTTTDGAPGAEIVIRVRGGGSITQDNSPLYIVDGFPVDNINGIATTDIQSIDVLKDASSTAIYGARGANGVVIVTTKSPKAGKTSVSYNGYFKAGSLPRKLEVLSPYEFVLAQYEYARLRGEADVNGFTRYFGAFDDLELYKNQRGTDWQKELFGNSVNSQQHNLSISGGSEKTKMSFSITNNKDEGLMRGSAYNRTYLNFKLNHDISKSLKLDLTSRFTNTNIDGAGTSGSSQIRISDGITTRPVNGLADQIVIDPNTVADEDYDQFLRSLVKPTELVTQDYRNRKDRNFNMAAAASWAIIDDLTFRSELGVDLNFGDHKRYYGPLTGESRNVGGNLPLGEVTNGFGNKYRIANTLNYKLDLGGDQNFTFLLGQELLANRSKSEFVRAKYFAAHTSPETLFGSMQSGTLDRQFTFQQPDNNMSSFFGRVEYDLKNKYLFKATLRADGSSKFAPGNRWGFFPAASVGWRIAEENFLKDVQFLSDLKLRFSYGEAGNNRIDDNMWRRTFAIDNNRPIGFGDVPQPYWRAESTILVNPDLKWETTVTRNLGLDFGFFQNRFSGTLDAYHNTTKDLLVQSVIPGYLGYEFQQQNIGQTSNRGIELGLNANILDKKDFSLSANFNIGLNRSNIDKLDGVNVRSYNSNWAGTDLKAQDDYRVIVGQTIGLMYGFVTDGYYTVDDFESYDPATNRYVLKEGVPSVGSYLGGISLRPGVLKLKDLNDDGTIDPNNDRTIIGSALPKHSGGFGLNATFKGFDFSTLFNWVYGNDVYNSGRISFNMLHRTSYGNMLNTMNSENRFKYVDQNGALVTDLEALRQLNQNATMWSPFSMGGASPVVHSWAVEDGSFLRLSNITVGYSLPKNLISRIKMSQFRIYGTVYNALLWTKYSGYDPEVSTTRSSSYAALTPGVDYSAYPKARTFTVGVNATF